MLSPVRIGSADPPWVQTRDAVLQRAQHLGIELLPSDTSSTTSLDDDQITLVEEVLVQNRDALRSYPEIILSHLPMTIATHAEAPKQENI